MEKNISISELNFYIKKSLENDIFLMNLNVEGEISNIKYHPTGHIYFTLKDEKSRVNAIMFASYAKSLKETFKDGDKVVVKCKIGVYEASGSYQLYVSSMSKLGIGNLYIEFERLKKKLDEEGVFSQAHKKPIKKYPTKIAIISASTGAALQDMRTTYLRRWPIADITLHPSLVQGKEASKDIVKNIKEASTGDYDLIIIARGGGSIEDLWCFNEEEVARAIIECPLPIISGVGHEIDFTIADFASSLRAPTPTAAIEMVTPNIDDVLYSIIELDKRLLNAQKKIIESNKNKINDLQNSYVLKNPLNYLANKKHYINHLNEKLKSFSNYIITENRTKLELFTLRINHLHQKNIESKKNLFKQKVSELESISPLKVLSRGYSIVTDESNNVISDSSKVELNQNLKIRLEKGNLQVEVKGKEE